MAYETIERLLSRRGEKVAAFLTVENAVGMAVFAGPLFVVGDLPLLLRAVAVALAAVLGFLITMETDGMMFCERILWRARGEVRLMLRGRTLTPDDLLGTRSVAHSHRAVARDGIVRKARQSRAAATPTLAGRLHTPQHAVLVRKRSIEASTLPPEVHRADHPA